MHPIAVRGRECYDCGCFVPVNLVLPETTAYRCSICKALHETEEQAERCCPTGYYQEPE